jgi:hypothetical protein
MHEKEHETKAAKESSKNRMLQEDHSTQLSNAIDLEWQNQERKIALALSKLREQFEEERHCWEGTNYFFVNSG